MREPNGNLPGWYEGNRMVIASAVIFRIGPTLISMLIKLIVDSPIE